LECDFLQSGKQRGKGGKTTGNILAVSDKSLKRKKGTKDRNPLANNRNGVSYP
jgi:hypothetical protein